MQLKQMPHNIHIKYTYILRLQLNRNCIIKLIFDMRSKVHQSVHSEIYSPETYKLIELIQHQHIQHTILITIVVHRLGGWLILHLSIAQARREAELRSI